MPKASREIVVSNSLGLHARPAMQFVDLANQFTSKVTVYKGGPDPLEHIVDHGLQIAHDHVKVVDNIFE